MGVAASAVACAMPPDVPVVTHKFAIKSHRESRALFEVIKVSEVVVPLSTLELGEAVYFVVVQSLS